MVKSFVGVADSDSIATYPYLHVRAVNSQTAGVCVGIKKSIFMSHPKKP